MGREIYDIINDMAEVLNASQMQKLQEVLVKRLSENTVSDYLQTTNVEFLDMFLNPPWSSILANSNVCTQHRIGPRGARAPPVPSCKLSTRRAPYLPTPAPPTLNAAPLPLPLSPRAWEPPKIMHRGGGGGCRTNPCT